MGSVCKRIKIKNIEIDSCSIVENPKDRRCIFTEFELSPGKIHDYITLRYLRDEENTGKVPEDSRQFCIATKTWICFDNYYSVFYSSIRF